MALHLQTWVKKSTGVDVATVTVEDFLDIANWVGQGALLAVSAVEGPKIEIYVNDEIAREGDLIVKDEGHFYVTTLNKLKEYYNRK